MRPIASSLFKRSTLQPWPKLKAEVEKTEDEWRSELTPEQFEVLRRHGTERAGTSPLNYEKRDGVFCCAGCGEPLFAADTKFESGSGWPSFWAPLDGAVTHDHRP